MSCWTKDKLENMLKDVVNVRDLSERLMTSCWTKDELENMPEDVVNVLDLSDWMIEEHGTDGY